VERCREKYEWELAERLWEKEGGDSGENLDLAIGKSFGGTVIERCSLNLEVLCNEGVDWRSMASTRVALKKKGWWDESKNSHDPTPAYKGRLTGYCSVVTKDPSSPKTMGCLPLFVLPPLFGSKAVAKQRL
jgi:hypothetical protein